MITLYDGLKTGKDLIFRLYIPKQTNGEVFLTFKQITGLLKLY